MYQFLFAIILSLSGLCYYIWNENTVLKDNNLKLEDPIEMQRKINNGTKHIMEDIEKLSGTVDSLDDGLQLQSPSN
jgi:hypothetical protein